jgi:hypothetical protein
LCRFLLNLSIFDNQEDVVHPKWTKNIRFHEKSVYDPSPVSTEGVGKRYKQILKARICKYTILTRDSIISTKICRRPILLFLSLR